MGFYGEDDLYCNELKDYYEPNSSSCMDEFMRLYQPVNKKIKQDSDQNYIFGETDKDLLELSGRPKYDPQECSIRHEILRRIGLQNTPGRALRKYLDKVAKGIEPNPWLSSAHSELTVRKMLRRFMLGMVIRACENEGVEHCELETSHLEAFEFIDNLNNELIQSLNAVGNFSPEQLRCAKSNCQKAFVSKDVANVLVSRILGDYTRCQVPECLHSLDTHDDVNYLLVEGGSYSNKLEMPDHLDAPSKLLCLCSFHNGIFEFMFDIIHMKWNVYQNCLFHVTKILKTTSYTDSDDVIDELPSNLIRSLVNFYMTRYFCLWAFGDVELWSRLGCTLFQVLFGCES